MKTQKKFSIQYQTWQGKSLISELKYRPSCKDEPVVIYSDGEEVLEFDSIEKAEKEIDKILQHKRLMFKVVKLAKT